MQKDFGARADGIAVLLRAEPGATAAQSERGDAAGARARSPMSKELTLPPAAARRAKRSFCELAPRCCPAQQPLRGRADRLGDDAARRARPGRRQGGVTTYLAGQPTIWAGMQELSKEDLAKAESARLPDRRADPAGRLRLARRRGPAAGARLRQRDGHRRAHLLHLAGDGDLGVRHQHGLDDRDRGGDRLLALHPRPLPRGAASRAASPTTPARRRSRLRAWRSPSPASP